MIFLEDKAYSSKSTCAWEYGFLRYLRQWVSVSDISSRSGMANLENALERKTIL